MIRPSRRATARSARTRPVCSSTAIRRQLRRVVQAMCCAAGRRAQVGFQTDPPGNLLTPMSESAAIGPADCWRSHSAHCRALFGDVAGTCADARTPDSCHRSDRSSRAPQSSLRHRPTPHPPIRSGTARRGRRPRNSVSRPKRKPRQGRSERQAQGKPRPDEADRSRGRGGATRARCAKAKAEAEAKAKASGG